MTARRFPPPWSVEELNDACFVVKDSNGQQLAAVYFEEESVRRSAAKLLTRDEARRIAAEQPLFSSISTAHVREGHLLEGERGGTKAKPLA